MKNENKIRRVETSESLFDILSNLPNNKFVSMCYINNVKLANAPKKQLPKQPGQKGRAKSVIDWEQISNMLGIPNVAGVITITRYTGMRWVSHNKMAELYKQYKENFNKVNKQFGCLNEMCSRDSYQTKLAYGNGISVGNTENTNGRVYHNQNIYNVKTNVAYYAIDENGHLLSEIPVDKLKELKGNKAVSLTKYEKEIINGKSVEESQSLLESYHNELKNLKFNYATFYTSQILYMLGSDDYGYFYFINDKFCEDGSLKDMNIKSNELIDAAKQQYIEDYQILNKD
jgi:hypothetical protein